MVIVHFVYRLRPLAAQEVTHACYDVGDVLDIDGTQYEVFKVIWRSKWQVEVHVKKGE